MFKPNILPINTGLAFALPDNRNVLNARRIGFQPIDIDALGPTVHWNAATPGSALIATNLITQLSNSAPGKIRVFNAAASRPMTGTFFTSSAPWFSQSAQAKYYTDDSGGGNNVALSGTITGSAWHLFAAIVFTTTGSADVSVANTYTAAQIAGDPLGFWTPASIQASGLRSYYLDGATARASQYLPFVTGTKYILESSMGALAPFSLSLNLNGGTPVTGNGVGSITQAGLGSTSVLGGSSAAFTNCGAEIAEFVCFSRSLDAATAQSVRLTLGQRWGISTL